MSVDTRDVVVVGGGTGGAFAAATAAAEGLDVALLERKSPEEAGHIACGDAIKGASTFPDVIDVDRLKDESFVNRNVRRAVFENPKGEDVEVTFGEPGAVLDRKRYGEVLVEEAERAGAEVHFDTVVRDVRQADDGRVTGVEAVREGDPVEYEARVTVDAAGALSILQDKADLSGATFDTNVSYDQFCSAYREVVETREPVDWDDAIVFKPTEELGYLWYFPRTDREINVGLGFQMNKDPMTLVDVLKRDLRGHPDFRGAEVRDKLGAALPTRRPYDSAVAPGLVAVGDAAGHVNPTTGGGIPGAAKAGTWAARRIVDALSRGAATEGALWEYNRDVMTDFGKDFATVDLYNVWGGAHEVDELVDIVGSIPGQQLADALSHGESSMSLGLKLRTIVDTFGHWGTLYELYRLTGKARELKEHYRRYPSSPGAFGAWRDRRDAIMNEVYELTGADPKY